MAAHSEVTVTPAKIVRFFHELRRRKVFRVIAGYSVGAFVVIQLADIIVPAFELSEHYVVYVLGIVIIGLPIALALSWRYEFTDTGLELTTGKADAGTAAQPAKKGKRADTALAAIAVLPFENLTPAAPRAWLAEALPLELQSLLSRVHDLRVVSRQSTAAHSAAKADLPTIARDLNVNYVISGSVADLGERIQINVQLDDTSEDKLLWSERYNVVADDVARLQRKISERVVATFGGERLRAEIGRANEAATADATAWQLVQQARSYLLDYTPSSIAAAIPMLRQAVKLDPKYAVAYATLGQVTAEKTINGICADAAADRAFALDAIRRAEQLAPRDPVVLRAAGCVHAFTGSYRRSIELLRHAIKLSPYDAGTWGYLGWPLVATGAPEDLREVHEIVDRLLSASPQHPGRLYWLFHKSVAYTCSDESEKALPLAEEYAAEQPTFALGLMHLANVLGRLGRTDDARRTLKISAGSNPLMDARYYIQLMAVLTDQESVIARRTSGLRAAGVLDEVKAS